MKPLIISTPSLQNLRQKYVSTVLTFLFWVIWIFLWTPLVTLVGWVLGLEQVYFQMVALDGYREVLKDFVLFLEWVAVMGGALAIWALYNFLRFRNVERRTALPPVTMTQQATFFRVDAEILAKHQQARCLSVSFDANGNIVEHEVLPLNPSASK